MDVQTRARIAARLDARASRLARQITALDTELAAVVREAAALRRGPAGSSQDPRFDDADEVELVVDLPPAFDRGRCDRSR